MATEIIKRDDNRVTVLAGVTDDANQDITMFRVDPTTKYLKVVASGIGLAVLDEGVSVVTTATSMNFVGSAVSATAVGNAVTVTISAADTALDNLASVAINTALLPATAGALDFGSATKPWAVLWFAGTSGTPGTNNFKFTGASTSGTRTITAPDASGTMTLLGNTSTGSGAVVLASTPALTSPKIITDISDTNGNEIIKVTATGSAVNEITLANAATGNNATITASGETNVGITITGKGTKGVLTGNASLQTVVTLSDGATPALDASLGNVFVLTAAGDRTIAVPSNAFGGQKIIIQHIASGGARTLALNSGAGGFGFGSDITALTQTASGKTDYIGCVYSAASTLWHVVAYTKGYT